MLSITINKLPKNLFSPWLQLHTQFPMAVKTFWFVISIRTCVFELLTRRRSISWAFVWLGPHLHGALCFISHRPGAVPHLSRPSAHSKFCTRSSEAPLPSYDLFLKLPFVCQRGHARCINFQHEACIGWHTLKTEVVAWVICFLKSKPLLIV